MAKAVKLVHEIHTSERKSYRACRRRWNWLFRDSYYPITTAKPLEFGTAFHEAMEVYYDPDTWHLDRQVVAATAIAAFVNKCEEQRKKFLDQTNVMYLEDEVQQDYDERLALGRGMLNHFFNNVAPKYDKGFKPLRVEVPFSVPIVNPETGEQLYCWCLVCHEKWAKAGKDPIDFKGLPVTYEGRIDMLAEDEFGDYWIVDWKTAARLSTDNDEFLYLDDQIASYVMALVLHLGMPVRGFVYVEIKKGFPLPPPKNKTQRLGRWYSVAKNMDTDYPTYLATVSEHDKDAYEAGLYDEFLDWLKEEGPRYTERYQISKSDYENRETAKNIYLEALEMTNQDISIYPSPGRFGCNFCAFRQPCMGKNMGEDYQYTLDTLFEKREHYYVRPEPSTDSKGGE